MQRVTFGKFLDKTTAYERMPVSINPGLRRGVWISQVLILMCFLVYQYLPPGSYVRNAPLFMWTGGWLAGAWDFTAEHRQLLVMACGFVFFITFALIFPTHFYQTAEIGLHAFLFLPVIFAAINVLFVITLLLPLLTNIVLWMLFLLFCIVVCIILLAILFRLFSH